MMIQFFYPQTWDMRPQSKQSANSENSLTQQRLMLSLKVTQRGVQMVSRSRHSRCIASRNKHHWYYMPREGSFIHNLLALLSAKETHNTALPQSQLRSTDKTNSGEIKGKECEPQSITREMLQELTTSLCSPCPGLHLSSGL